MKLLSQLKKLKNSEVGKLVAKRISEFEKIKSKVKIFQELCFCILTANFNAERAIKIQESIGKGFLEFSKQKLASLLKKLGHRFPKTRASYIIEARKFLDKIYMVVKSYDCCSAREWLVKNIRGIGYKEASHFLRNIGCKNLAILDFHVLDLLARNKIIHKPKILTKKKYLTIENKLKNFAKMLNLSLAELDLYLWYLETGKILK